MIALCIGLLAGCSENNAPTEEPSQQTEPSQVTPEESEPDNAVDLGDTYWVANRWYRENEEITEEDQVLPTSFWSLDLLVLADGTARFRDLHDGVFLLDDSYLNLTWETTAEGEILFYNALYSNPVLRGSCDDGVLTLNYWDTVLTMQQQAMPQNPGQVYIPAELNGTWLLVSGETEGDVYDVMPHELTSLVFAVSSVGEQLYQYADIERRDREGNMQHTSYAQILELLDAPLYVDCSNEQWSVRIGDPAPRDEDDNPMEAELYATLVGEDELLVQNYYTLDGSPAVSYQTYLRMTDLKSWMDYQSMSLNLSNWAVTGYRSAAGEDLPIPAEMEDFTVTLDEDQSCVVCFGETQYFGLWDLGAGGVVMLRSDENADDPFWFGGAISGYYVEVGEESVETYEMGLYYQGGILKLTLDSRG